jgi:FAD/FMN-containing dehydrogenase
VNAPADFRGIFTTDETARAVYSEAAGITQLIPSAIAVPVDAEDVQTLLRWASRDKVAVTPRGSGSSMAGGAVGRGVILDLSRLDSIGEPDSQRRTIRVGPGAICAKVNDRAGKAGLRLPVDPSSAKFCTIGGMTATNASGAHTLRFGSMRAWVESIDCVFADGSRGIIRRDSEVPPNIPAIGAFLHTLQSRMPTLRSRDPFVHKGVRKDSSGFGVGAYAESGDLADLLIGSEGTLAVFVGLEVRLAPMPGAVTSVLAEFNSLESAVGAAQKATALGASACELLDRTFLEFAGTFPAGSSPEAVLLAEVEADTDVKAETNAETLAGAFTTAGARNVRVGISPIDQREIWELRHAASPILGKLDPRLKSMQVVEDGAVPPRNLAAYVQGLRTAFADRGMRGVIFGHAGDAHVHANPLIDTTEQGWQDKTESLLEEIVALIARLGGTLSGEHGDGRLRAPYLDRVWSAEAMQLFQDLKKCFDPAGILNPGVKLSGVRPMDPIKYDESLPVLPGRARSALDRVTSERAYDQFRLSLIGLSQ